MGKSIAKGIYFLAVTALAISVCVSLLQVPQPWRGTLVLWLFGVGSIGTLAVLVLRQHHAYKTSLQEQGVRYTPRRRRTTRSTQRRQSGLRVVSASGQGGARRVVR